MICEGYNSVSQAPRKVSLGPKAWFFMTAFVRLRTEVREAAWVRGWPEGALGLAQETAECSERLWSPGLSLEGWSLGLLSHHFVWPSGTCSREISPNTLFPLFLTRGIIRVN